MNGGDLATWTAAVVALGLGVWANCAQWAKEGLAKNSAREMFAMPLAVMRMHAKGCQHILYEPAMMGPDFKPSSGFWETLEFYREIFSDKFLASSVVYSLALGAKDAALVGRVTGLCSVLSSQMDIEIKRKECWREDAAIALRCAVDIEKALTPMDWLPSLESKFDDGLDPERYSLKRSKFLQQL